MLIGHAHITIVLEVAMKNWEILSENKCHHPLKLPLDLPKLCGYTMDACDHAIHVTELFHCIYHRANIAFEKKRSDCGLDRDRIIFSDVGVANNWNTVISGTLSQQRCVSDSEVGSKYKMGFRRLSRTLPCIEYRNRCTRP
jgi:hypothetical protein